MPGFAEPCRLQRWPSGCWHLRGPGGSWDNSFQVIWSPGSIVVTGDVGDAVFGRVTGFGSPIEAADFLDGIGFDYLMSKSNLKREFDRAATAAAIVAMAETLRAAGPFADGMPRPRGISRNDPSLNGWKQIATFLGRDETMDWRRPGVRRRLAAWLADHADLDAEAAVDMSDDIEMARYGWPERCHALHHALTRWAAAMLAAEPAWHRAWRRARVQWRSLRRDIERRDILFRPVVLDLGGTVYDGGGLWARRGDAYRQISRLRAFGLDLGRLGFWVASGSCPADDRIAQRQRQAEAAIKRAALERPAR